MFSSMSSVARWVQSPVVKVKGVSPARKTNWGRLALRPFCLCAFVPLRPLCTQRRMSVACPIPPIRPHHRSYYHALHVSLFSKPCPLGWVGSCAKQAQRGKAGRAFLGRCPSHQSCVFGGGSAAARESLSSPPPLCLRCPAWSHALSHPPRLPFQRCCHRCPCSHTWRQQAHACAMQWPTGFQTNKHFSTSAYLEYKQTRPKNGGN
jgi:hypothetical protein